MLQFILPVVLFMLGIAAIVTHVAARLPAKNRVKFCTVLYTLLLTPSWAPATIVAIPVPFGAILGMGLIIGAPLEVLDILLSSWWWHLPAFVLTSFISHKVATKFLGTSSVPSAHS